jgi:hypothetical protein
MERVPPFPGHRRAARDVNSQVRATTPRDEEAVIALLTRAFRLGRNAPFVQPRLLRWKYWEPRDDFGDPRSLAFEREGRIAAHVGLWPRLALSAEGRLEQGVHLIDWASEGGGSGVALVQHVMSQYDFVCAIGGSSATQAVLPKLGFRLQTRAQIWARPLRPWRQLMHHQMRNTRLPLRLLRNLIWSAHPRHRATTDWRAVPTNAPSDSSALRLDEHVDKRFIAYIQRCPTARMLPFTITHHPRTVGHFVLAVAAMQARLAGMALEEPTPERWRVGLELAQHAVLHHTDACELVLRGAGEDLAIAAAAAGMRPRAKAPIYTYRRDGKTDAVPLRFQMWDDDSTFLAGSAPDFLT